MKLSQLFSGEVRSDSAASHALQLTPAQIEQVRRQIRSLVPGQTISGEIVARNGGEVQIRLSEDLLLNARVDRNLNLEVGRNMTFEVKNNGISLLLSPLFTNVATDINVLKALDMAGLPANSLSVDMTEQLMAAGMPVNRGSLQQIFREINNFPQGEVSDIVNLHRLQMPVDEANVNQMVSYRNLSHQLTEGIGDILGALPEVFDSMAAAGDRAGAVGLYREVLRLVSAAGLPEHSAPLAMAQGEQEDFVETPAQVPRQAGAAESQEMPKMQEMPEGGRIALPRESGREEIPQELRAAVAREALELLDGVRLPEGEASALDSMQRMRSAISQFARGETSVPQFFALLDSLAAEANVSPESMRLFEKIFSGTKFRSILSAQLKNNWMLRPEELASPGRVEELYRRLDSQMKSLSHALENAGQTGGAAYRAVTSLSQNIDFLQQINQAYPYVQLPLRLQQGDAHGELYVYTNRGKRLSEDGSVSALLHLDMEYLGPVDVHVSLKGSKVSTRFYLQDDGMLDFLSAHMDVLTRRLQKRGYDCSCSMVLRKEGGEATRGGLEPVLRQNRGVPLAQYAFDVRT